MCCSYMLLPLFFLSFFSFCSLFLPVVAVDHHSSGLLMGLVGCPSPSIDVRRKVAGLGWPARRRRDEERGAGARGRRVGWLPRRSSRCGHMRPAVRASPFRFCARRGSCRLLSLRWGRGCGSSTAVSLSCSNLRLGRTLDRHAEAEKEDGWNLLRILAERFDVSCLWRVVLQLTCLVQHTISICLSPSLTRPRPPTPPHTYITHYVRTVVSCPRLGANPGCRSQWPRTHRGNGQHENDRKGPEPE